MRLLVTGTSGQLAQTLLERGLARGIDIVALRRPQLDLTIPSTLAVALADARPAVVVSAAAYTAVDKAESEEALALRVNAQGAGDLAHACERFGVPVIHLSTDYVFDGAKPAPYVEGDATAPLNAYGRSKLAGEAAVARACPRHLILRTSWIHSPYGTNFVKTMLRLAETRPEVRVVDDQRGCPTQALDLADAIITLGERIAGRPAGAGEWGVYHAAGTGETTWCGLAREIFAIAAARGRPSPVVTPIATTDYPTPARRPANSRLDCSKLASTFGIALPDWRDGARRSVEQLA
jgi:dTDP-4-dehydrorhamnose reductase